MGSRVCASRTRTYTAKARSCLLSPVSEQKRRNTHEISSRELVFNSESFVRAPPRKLSFSQTLETLQLRHYNCIEESRCVSSSWIATERNDPPNEKRLLFPDRVSVSTKLKLHSSRLIRFTYWTNCKSFLPTSYTRLEESTVNLLSRIIFIFEKPPEDIFCKLRK